MPSAEPRPINHYIDGALTRDEPGRRGPVYNPATGEQTGSVALASAERSREAIAAARAALPAWQAMTPLARARVLFRFKALLERDLMRVAESITREHGKVLSDARGEVIRGLEVVEFACGIPHLLKGEHSGQVGSDVDAWSQRYPVGVCAGITPFNFPAMVPMWMFPIAIACGNTFVLKPSEKAPSTPLLLAELLEEAGLPAGVFNVLNGDREAVETLLTDPDVGAISFVGSTPIAETIYSTGSAHGKRVQALGGAKNHMVIMPDADIEAAADALMGAAYGSAGERCMAISVAVPVGEQTAEALVAALRSRLERLHVGNGLADDEPQMGPLITREHRDRVAEYVRIGLAEGAVLAHDGRDISVADHPDGFYMGACLFDHVTPAMRIYNEEIFGPVLSVVRAEHFDAAVDIVNGHEYGNGTAIFTRDGDAARTYADVVEAGMVGINVPIPVPMAFYSFGGWKRSRFGVLHAHGPDGVRFYTRMKTITARWPRGVRDDNQFVMPTLR